MGSAACIQFVGHPSLPSPQGGIEDIMEDGTFRCSGCETPLYDNEARFEAGSGWPCFYTCLPNAVWQWCSLAVVQSSSGAV